MIESCSDCRFFHRDAHGSGTCRRYGPALPIESYGRWPRVGPEEWCGDFQVSERLAPCEICTKPVGENAVKLVKGYVCKSCCDVKLGLTKAP